MSQQYNNEYELVLEQREFLMEALQSIANAPDLAFPQLISEQVARNKHWQEVARAALAKAGV